MERRMAEEKPAVVDFLEAALSQVEMALAEKAGNFEAARSALEDAGLVVKQFTDHDTGIRTTTITEDMQKRR